MVRDQGDTPRTPPEESQSQQSPPGRPPQQSPQGQPTGGPPQGRQPPQGPSDRQSQGQQGGQLGRSSQGMQQGGQSQHSQRGQQSQQGGQFGRSSQGMQQGQQPPQGGLQGSQQRGQQGRQPQRGPPGAMQSQQPGTMQSPQTGTMQSPQTGSMQSQQSGAMGAGMQGQPMQQRGSQLSQLQQSGGGAGLLEPITIDDVVTTEVYTIEPDTQISEVVGQMDELNVGSAIVQEDDTPIGILTDRKIAMALADDPDVAERTADDLTGEEVVSAMTGTQISEVLDKMSDEHIRRIPVVDENGELEGIVTLDDILMLLESKMSQATDTIQGQLPDI